MSSEKFDPYRQRTAEVMVWRVFPRSAGVVCAAIAFAITLRPESALSVGVIAALAFYVFRWLIPDIYDRGCWTMGCMFVVFPTALWFVRWPAVITLGVVAWLRGAPPGTAALTAGGLLLLDVLMTEGPWYGGFVRIIRKLLGKGRQRSGPPTVAELAGLYTMLFHGGDENQLDWVLERIGVLERELGEEGTAQARVMAELDARRYDSLM